MAEGTTKHVRMLDELLADHQGGMNEWQKGFCNDVRKTAERFPLKPKQKAKVDEIWAEVVEGKGRQNGPVVVLPKPYNGWSIIQESKFDFYVAYKDNKIGAKQTIEDATVIMDWLSNSDEQLIEFFCDCQGEQPLQKLDSHDEIPYTEPAEDVPEPF